MKKAVNILLILVPIFSVGQIKSISPEEIIFKMEKEMLLIYSLSFTVDCNDKPMNSDSLRTRVFYLNAQRNKNNKVYHFDWQHQEENKIGNFQLFYREDDLYFIAEKVKIVTIHKDAGKINSGSYFETMRRWSLFDEIIYQDLHQDKSLSFSEEFKDDKYWIIEILYPKGGKDVLWIDKATYFPMKKMEIVKFGNLEQILTVEVKDLKINEPIPKESFNLEKYLDTYEVNYAEEKEEKAPQLSDFELHLTDAEIDTLFQTEFYHPTKGKLKLADADEKLFLLDFWYMSCAPCLLAMPKMQKLHKEHHGAGLRVIGVNWTDTKDVEFVAKKLKERGLTYDNYFADKKLQKTLGVKAFPTVILVNKHGQVIYAGVNSSFDYLEGLILENL